MQTIISKIKERAKKEKKKIVLPESEDVRVLKAASIVSLENIAEIILIGDKNKIKEICIKENIDLTKVQIVNPVTSEYTNEFANKLYELRKAKGMTEEKANELVHDYIHFGVMMVKENIADGLVCGACHSTADTLRPALQIVKTRKDAKCVSAFFIMEMSNSDYRDAYIFADSGLIEFPTEEQRAEIAIQSAESCKLLLEEEPCIAMLSYSTKGSAKSDSIDSVNKSLEMVRSSRPDLDIDGELQVDAAVDKKVASLKAPDSKVAGNANVFVFPDLNAGNIGYKLVQRFGHANAYGPVTQGLAKPINDLSRGCVPEDIVGVIAITSLQCEENEKCE